jgi:hypothetical protein
MKSEKFNTWVDEVGVVKAHELVSEYASKHGQRPLTYQAIQQWKINGVPANRAICVERVSGIDRSDLRPDIYPVDEVA